MNESECPMELIEHYAQKNDLLVSDNLIWFATAIWNESINNKGGQHESVQRTETT